MVETITEEIVKSDLKEVVNKLRPDSIAKEIEKKCQNIYPLHDVFIRKVFKFTNQLIFIISISYYYSVITSYFYIPGQSFEETTYGYW